MRSSSSPPKDNRNLKQEHQESHSTNNTDSARAKVTTRPNSSCRMPPHSSINQPCVGDIDADSVSTGSNWGRTNLSQMRQMQWSSSSEDMLFPSKLFLMLVDAHEQDFEDIVSWGHGPSSFNVHKKNIFQHQILPKYFKMTKYKSFTKQLHNYDFKWIRGGPDKGGCKWTLRYFYFPNWTSQ